MSNEKSKMFKTQNTKGDFIKLNKRVEKESNKGISLIVLVITIIVIIILAAAVILTLTNNNPIENAKQAAFVNDLSSFQDELDMYKANEYAKNLGDFDPATLNADSTNTTLLYTYIPSLEGKTKYETEVAVVAGQLRYIGDDEKKQTWATSINIVLGTEAATPEVPVATGPNAPVLATGMTAIKWNATTSEWDEVTSPSTDTSWYSYTETDKQWANAKTLDGSMWVWIPRYEYKIANPHTSTAETIDVNFINGTGNGIGGDYTTTYGLHPAFTFGTDQLTGIWVAKFEASGTTSAVDVKPNVSSLRSITIDARFTACRNMENNTIKYGWSTIDLDTHLMKNVEWGAIAYISNSIYGKNSEININDNASYLTGGGAYATNVAQSTTGNVYGIYDMSGCAYDIVAAYVNNGNASLTTYGASLVSALTKYKDVYLSSVGDTQLENYTGNTSKLGDAVYEVSTSYIGNTSWYGKTSIMPYLNGPFFLRGGVSTAGGLFAFNGNSGSNGYNHVGFRPVVVLGSEL